MISPAEWSFAEIVKVDAARGLRLESASPFNEIVEQLASALNEALSAGELRCGVDFFRACPRAILQFRVTPELYDVFFNARTGYRAQFWISPECGLASNAECMNKLTAVLAALPDRFVAREIICRTGGAHREDQDVGAREVTREFFLTSFCSRSAKVWFGERLIQGNVGLLPSLNDEVMLAARRMEVPRWPTARAPYPDAEFAWLDLKGAFIGCDQPKSSEVRAHDLHKTGWT
jgi:hypothetical protein